MTGKGFGLGMLAVVVSLLCFAVVSASVSAAPLLAVLDFESGEGYLRTLRLNRREFMDGLAQQLTNKLVDTGEVRLVERSRIREVLAEQDFGRSGRVDTATAAAIGRILGAEYLILGTLERLEVKDRGRITVGPLTLSGIESDIVLRARIVSAETAEIVMSLEGRGTALETGIRVRDLYGVSFGSPAFAQSALGKSVEEAVDAMVVDLQERYEALEATPESDVLRGAVVLVLSRDRLIVDIGSTDDLRVGQRGRLVERIRVEGIEGLVTVPYGRVEVESVDPHAAVLRVLDAEQRPHEGDAVEFE